MVKIHYIFFHITASKEDNFLYFSNYTLLHIFFTSLLVILYKRFLFVVLITYKAVIYFLFISLIVHLCQICFQFFQAFNSLAELLVSFQDPFLPFIKRSIRVITIYYPFLNFKLIAKHTLQGNIHPLFNHTDVRLTSLVPCTQESLIMCELNQFVCRNQNLKVQ